MITNQLFIVVTIVFSNVVLKSRPWPRGQIFMALASGRVAVAFKVKALSLRTGLTITQAGKAR